MKVLIPSSLLSYTRQMWVDAEGATLDALLRDLDRQYPGLRFRMVDEQDRLRPHMRVFIEAKPVHDLSRALDPAVPVHIVQALSGG
ncbi:MoaD/ThiS family protein [Sphaerotilus mobilis]|uniref:Molybdopterin synthase subunit MoaD n=1 Tax=Sphaerotilus mobilis TaxID=47994 RepID=A0A4Q7LI93_9BURK|nr:MoaD/ThiS family protein [Sphaerotilus mobilis]RZS53089.1 molybdopterin synthase subunit MoaD [Sphaerotilus mobilis]